MRVFLCDLSSGWYQQLERSNQRMVFNLLETQTKELNDTNDKISKSSHQGSTRKQNQLRELAIC